MGRCIAGMEPLTTTESRVLALVDGGLSNREIAVALSITIGTVKCNLHRVYEKLQVTSRLQAVAWVREHGDLAASMTALPPPARASKFVLGP
jgi:DNA-binding NarL/FixJ family response regulator